MPSHNKNILVVANKSLQLYFCHFVKDFRQNIKPIMQVNTIIYFSWCHWRVCMTWTRIWTLHIFTCSTFRLVSICSLFGFTFCMHLNNNIRHNFCHFQSHVEQRIKPIMPLTTTIQLALHRFVHLAYMFYTYTLYLLYKLQVTSSHMLALLSMGWVFEI